jgi:hypothetical protein
MLKFRCKVCDQKIGVPDEWADHLVRCPRCKGAIEVPKVIQVEVRRAPVFADSDKPVAPPKPAPTHPPGAASKPASRKPPPKSPPAAEPIITKAKVPANGDVFAKPPVPRSPKKASTAATPPVLKPPVVKAPAAPVSRKKQSKSPISDRLGFSDEPGPASSTAVADLLKSLGNTAEVPPKESPAVKAKAAQPRKPKKDAPKNQGVRALAAVGLLAGVAALVLNVVPAWTKFSLPFAVIGILTGILATLGRTPRRGPELALACAAFVVSGSAGVLALLVSTGVLPGGTSARLVAGGPAINLSERKGDVEVRVRSARVVHPVVYARGEWKSLKTLPQSCLQIDLEVRDSARGKAAYRSWGQLRDGIEPPALSDNEGNTLKLLDFTPLVPAGRPRQSSVPLSGSGVGDVLIFELPPAAAQSLDLQLPAANFGADGFVEFHIPSAMLHR